MLRSSQSIPISRFPSSHLDRSSSTKFLARLKPMMKYLPAIACKSQWKLSFLAGCLGNRPGKPSKFGGTGDSPWLSCHDDSPRKRSGKVPGNTPVGFYRQVHVMFPVPTPKSLQHLLLRIVGEEKHESAVGFYCQVHVIFLFQHQSDYNISY